MAEGIQPRRAEALFYERRSSAMWLQIVVLLSGVASIVIGIVAYFTGDDGLAPTLVAVVGGIGIIVLLLPMAGVVLVGDHSVVLSLRPFVRRTIAGADIVELEKLDRVSSMRYGGTGWRRSKEGQVLIMGAGYPVRIRTSAGKTLLAVTERPDELVDALRSIAGGRV